MFEEMTLLYGSAATIAFVHTLLGPDHYVPFAAMARVGDWSIRRTLIVTTLCGIGHVLSSVVLGLIGLSLGWAVFRLEKVESTRGAIAGWMLIAFGLVYFAWGVVRALRNRPHTHLHRHSDGTLHAHKHVHEVEHLHVHAHPEPRDSSRAPSGHAVPATEGVNDAPQRESLTPWVLFTIFLFGPCEPLIPLVMYPAAKGRSWDVLCVVLIFGLITISTMLSIVMLLVRGASMVHSARFARFSHATAGLVILACGVAVKAGL